MPSVGPSSAPLVLGFSSSTEEIEVKESDRLTTDLDRAFVRARGWLDPRAASPSKTGDGAGEGVRELSESTEAA